MRTIRKILLCVLFYLLIGCMVTFGFLTNRRGGGRDDVGAVVGGMIIGPFIWPGSQTTKESG